MRVPKEAIQLRQQPLNSCVSLSYCQISIQLQTNMTVGYGHQVCFYPNIPQLVLAVWVAVTQVQALALDLLSCMRFS